MALVAVGVMLTAGVEVELPPAMERMEVPEAVVPK
jgi:hypothetical protein